MSIFIIYTPDLPTFAPHGVSLDMTDELATARRRCKHLLTRVFGMVSLSLTAWLFTRLARTRVCGVLLLVCGDAISVVVHYKYLHR